MSAIFMLKWHNILLFIAAIINVNIDWFSKPKKQMFKTVFIITILNLILFRPILGRKGVHKQCK